MPHTKNFIFALVATVVCFFIMRPFTPLNIVQFERAGTVEVAKKIMNEWSADELSNVKISIYIDFGFILAYCAAFMFACKAASVFSGVHWLIKIGALCTAMCWLAGMCDAIENIAMLKTLNEISQIPVSIAFYFATVKFATLAFLLFFIIICVIIGFLQKRMK